MLVLTRKLNQAIDINVNGEIVVVKVVQIKNGAIRLGIVAAREVSVGRLDENGERENKKTQRREPQKEGNDEEKKS